VHDPVVVFLLLVAAGAVFCVAALRDRSLIALGLLLWVLAVMLQNWPH